MIGRFKMRMAPPPGKTKVLDWNGLTVRTRRELENGSTVVPAGMTCSAEIGRGGTGLTIRTQPCQCCGVRVVMTRVHSSDVEPVVA